MGIADVFGNIGRSIGSMFSRVFGPTKSGIPTTVEESGVDFDYPIIYIPGPPNHNSQRDRSVNDAALPFSPEEYKKILMVLNFLKVLLRFGDLIEIM